MALGRGQPTPNRRAAAFTTGTTKGVGNSSGFGHAPPTSFHSAATISEQDQSESYGLHSLGTSRSPRGTRTQSQERVGALGRNILDFWAFFPSGALQLQLLERYILPVDYRFQRELKGIT